MEVKILCDQSKFKNLENKWVEILEKSKQNNPFLTFEWQSSWWEHFKRENCLFVVLVSEGKDIVGIAPLMLVMRFGFKELRFISSPVADYEDIIASGDDDYREKIFFAIFEYLSRNRDWDILRLKGIRLSSPNFKALERVARNKNRVNIKLSSHKDGAPFIDTKQTWEKYCQGLSRKFFSDTRRRIARMKEEDAVFSVRKVEMKNDIPLFLESLIRLHIHRRSSFQTRSVFEEPANRAFFKQVCENFFDRGWLDLSYLNLNGKTAAINLGFNYGNKFHYYIPAFDENFRKNAIARLLLFELIKVSFAKQMDCFDFMLGEEEYKKDFKPHIEPLYFLDIYPGKPKGILAYAFFNRINLGAKKLLGKKW